MMKFNVFDSLRSVLGGLGDKSRDKAAGVYFDDVDISDAELISAYSSNWIARKIIDIPVKDSLRKWRVWTGDDGKALKTEEIRLGLRNKIFEAMTKGRLFGGAAIYIGTEDQDPSMPLDPKTIKAGGIKYLAVMTRIELMANDIEQDPLSELYGKPISYTLSSPTGTATIHPSRLIIFKGSEHANVWLAPGINQGWGESVLKNVATTIKQAGGTLGNVASLVFEANVDVIRMPDLMDNVGEAEYQSEVLKRFALAAAAKGNNGMLILDKEEEYDRKSMSFSHLTEIIDAFLMACSAAADIPATRFLARSPNGMSSTGESDMNNYYDRLQGMQELEIGPVMALFDECLKRSASATDDSVYEWAPLKQLSDKELAEVGKSVTESLLRLDTIGSFSQEEMRAITISRLSESKAFPNIEAVIEETDAALEFDDEDDDDLELEPEPIDADAA